MLHVRFHCGADVGRKSVYGFELLVVTRSICRTSNVTELVLTIDLEAETEVPNRPFRSPKLVNIGVPCSKQVNNTSKHFIAACSYHTRASVGMKVFHC